MKKPDRIYFIEQEEVKDRLQNYFNNCEFPEWGTNERTFTLDPTHFNVTPEGIFEMWLHRVAFELDGNNANIVFDPKVNTPVIRFVVLSDPKGTSVYVTNTSERFNDFVNRALDKIV